MQRLLVARSVKGAWLAISAPAQRRAAQGGEILHYFIQQAKGGALRQP